MSAPCPQIEVTVADVARGAPVERNTPVIPVYEATIEDAPEPGPGKRALALTGHKARLGSMTCSHAEPSGAPIEAG
jgi:hypothetical protein